MLPVRNVLFELSRFFYIQNRTGSRGGGKNYNVPLLNGVLQRFLFPYPLRSSDLQTHFVQSKIATINRIT